MKATVKVLSAAVLATLVSLPAVAEQPFEAEVEARQAHMQLVKYNMGILGSMAKGKRDYNAEVAAAAASDMLMLATMNNMTLWPKGSDSSVEGLGSKTKASMWEADSTVMDKHQDWVNASKKMADVAGNGLGELKGAIRDLGKSCKGCHKAYKVK
ncbi:MAG: cytochrome c [Marinobacterium sp.]|nr:cytochrome c [Marinobacterium sp.]